MAVNGLLVSRVAFKSFFISKHYFHPTTRSRSPCDPEMHESGPLNPPAKFWPESFPERRNKSPTAVMSFSSYVCFIPLDIKLVIFLTLSQCSFSCLFSRINFKQSKPEEFVVCSVVVDYSILFLPFIQLCLPKPLRQSIRSVLWCLEWVHSLVRY